MRIGYAHEVCAEGLRTGSAQPALGQALLAPVCQGGSGIRLSLRHRL